tara:strand:+ start:88 stop:474 length:387 start_codon:yes stop_codon:yes gene_type:complete
MLKPKPKRKSKRLNKPRIKRKQASLTIPKIIPAMRAGETKFRKRNQSDPLADLAKKALKRKKIPGLDNKMFESITGDIVGTEEAFADAGLNIPEYGDSWMKNGGSIKKGMKKCKRASLRGGRKELRGA